MTEIGGRAARGDQRTLVGRARELATLGERLAAALAGRGALVLLSGEAGIGKTALAEALAIEAAARGALALTGHCYDLTETPPYGPWLDLFRRYPPDADPAPPGILAQPGGEGNPTSQDALFRQIADFLVAASACRPLVLLLDDLHWADPASLDLLRFLARELAALPILLVATYRSDELTRRHPLYALLPLLVREAQAARLDLRPIDVEATGELVRARYALSATDEDRLVAYLQGYAEGNPFYTGEILRTLEEEGLLQARRGAWVLDDLTAARVPPLLRQVVDARVARLGEAARDLLAVAAVIGQEAPLALWAAVSDTGEDTLLDLAERAAEAHLVAETPAGIRFAHALVREALYEGVPPLRRRNWHRRVAEGLRATAHPDPDAVAYHYRQAGDARAAEWLVRAGDRAYRAYAWLTAAERFEAALAVGEGARDDAGERGWLLLRLSRLRRYANPRQGIAYLDEALAVSTAVEDQALAGYCLFSRGLLYCFVGEMRRGLDELEAGCVMLETLSPADRARLQTLAYVVGITPDDHRGTLALWLADTGRHAAAIATAEPIVARAPASGPARGLGGSGYGDACLGLGSAFAACGRVAEARRALERARQAYRAVDHYLLLGNSAGTDLVRVVLPYQADRTRERRELVVEVEQALAQAGGVNSPLAGLASLPLLFLEGRWAEARTIAAQAARGAGSEPISMRLYPTGLLGALARELGDADLAWAQVREVLPAGPATVPGDTVFLPATGLQRLAAILSLDAGDLAAARAWLVAHDRWLAWGEALLGRAEGQLLWAMCHRAASDTVLAVRHAEQALAHASEPRQPLALLAAHRLLGELDTADGRHGDAAAHLDAALAVADACAAPYERALTLLALAELRAAEGRRDAAAGLLDEARATLTPLGAAPALARAEAIAAALATAAPPAVRYPAGLTAREVEVLRLVAEGLTDGQVAERLYLSPRTVSQHLRSVYNKLGVSSRAAAARFAAAHGLT